MANFFSINENPDFSDDDVRFEFVPSPKRKEANRSEIYLIEEKLRVPNVEKQIERERLTELLNKSLAQFGATLISGRSGTGKTALAADFSRRYKKVSWYSIESSESDWDIFSKYFEASLTGQNPATLDQSVESEADRKLEKIAYFTERLVTEVHANDKSKERLIVLDDAHNLFDSEWFTTFFYSFVGSLGPNMHLLMLCRGTPSLPLWRLRSKQVLGVLDESVLNFNIDETHELINALGASTSAADKLFLRSYGRVSKIKKLVDSLK